MSKYVPEYYYNTLELPLPSRNDLLRMSYLCHKITVDREPNKPEYRRGFEYVRRLSLVYWAQATGLTEQAQRIQMALLRMKKTMTKHQIGAAEELMMVVEDQMFDDMINSMGEP